MRRVLLAAFSLSACANLAGIEAGHLTEAAAGDASSNTAGTSPTVGGSGAGTAGNGIGASGASNGAGSAGSGAGAEGGQFANAGQGSGGTPGAGAPSTDAGAAGTADPCPTGMVRSASAQGFGYCIDAYEVTNAQYRAFTQAHTPQNTTQQAACSSNATFAPSTACSTALTDPPSVNLPVVCVDWCDAEAFCKSAGKRLCGRVGGQSNPPSDEANADASEWYAACIGPERSESGGQLCNDSQFDPNHPGPKSAANVPDCESTLSGVFNLSGNVAEWENSCESTSANASCNYRGGSFQDGPYELKCASANAAARNTASSSLGIRCCADAAG